MLDKRSLATFFVVHVDTIALVKGNDIQVLVIPSSASDWFPLKEIIVNLTERHCLRNKEGLDCSCARQAHPLAIPLPKWP